VRGLSAVANLAGEIGERQRNTALQLLHGLGCDVDIAVTALPAYSRGTVIVLLAEFERSQACFFALGKRGKRAEHVAGEAVDELLKFLATDGALDRWLADQLLLPMSCAGQPSALSTSEVTTHLLTNADVIRQFLPVDISVSGKPGEAATITVRTR
jgi:RNA 3'-terminal phosphate cyclase (ATP)